MKKEVPAYLKSALPSPSPRTESKRAESVLEPASAAQEDNATDSATIKIVEDVPAKSTKGKSTEKKPKFST